MSNRWPKQVPQLTSQEQKIRSDFMRTWLSVYPRDYSVMEKFNHECLKTSRLPSSCRTLEIGAGLGEHLKYENLVIQEYYALEIRDDFIKTIQQRFPGVKAICGDIQQKLNFPDGFFDRIMAIHVLEHLPNLPGALREIRRLIKPQGFCEFVLPCEGSLAYSLAREISAKRLFKKLYPKVSYDIFIKSEHLSTFEEIMVEIKKEGFVVEDAVFFPIPLPVVFCNLAAGLRCRVKA